jgi:hypothetical protein
MNKKNIIITATNSLYYESMKTLVASLHRTSFDAFDEFVVYDLGLSDEEKKEINSWEKCSVIDLKEAISEIPYENYLFPKWHAYKCFCVYHAGSDGDNILWLDSGVMVLRDLKEIFNIISVEDIFCVGDSHLNINYTSPSCVRIMNATESELHDTQLSSGIIGYKKNGNHQNIITEAYEFSLYETCVCGDEGNHRHDQSIYSILVSRNNIKKYDIDIYGYWTDINRNLNTAINNNVVIFVHRRGHLDNSNLRKKQLPIDNNELRIKLLDNELGPPYDYLCHHIVPETPVWSRNIDNPNVVIGVAKYGMSEVKNYPNAKKGVWIIEPSIVNGEVYVDAIKEQDNFDFIFTHNLELKDKITPSKFVFIPHGGTHLRNEDINIPEKTKLVSFIFSNKQWNANHRFRFEVYDKIKSNVDCYGSGVNNIFIPNKIDSLKEYAFSIVMENMISEDYFTEKIIDSFLSGTIPIYYGTSKIDTYFNSKGVFKFNTIEELTSILEKITIEGYKELLPVVKENFELAKKYIFPEKLIIEHIKKAL